MTSPQENWLWRVCLLHVHLQHMGDDAPDHAEAFQNARRCERRNFTIFSGTVCNPRRNTTGYGDEAWRLGRIHHIGFNGTSPAFAILKSSYSSLMDNSPCLYSNALDSTRTCDLHMVSNFSEETFTLPADCSLVAPIWIWTNTSTMWNTSTGWWRYVNPWPLHDLWQSWTEANELLMNFFLRRSIWDCHWMLKIYGNDVCLHLRIITK